MKTRNIDLNNTPLLTNNICRYIFLEAPTESELTKKAKEYEILLARALTNKYRLTHLSLDNNGQYELLPDGNYRTAIFLNFSGFAKEKITNPERTLQIIKHLTALESKKHEINSIISKLQNKKAMKHFVKSFTLPISVKQGATVDEAISTRQSQILEQLLSKINLTYISFYVCKKPTPSIEVTYKYDEAIRGFEEQNEPENR